MSIAVSSARPFGGLTASRISQRLGAVPTMHVAGLVLVVLVGGILASILTTSDPQWWQLHFSQLGTFHDLSGGLFNNTLKVGGMIVVVFAVRVRRDLVRLGRTAARRGAATMAQICLTTVGVNLALVGCIPLNTIKSLHDNVAAMMVLGFSALLLTSPVLLHRMPKRLLLTTVSAFVLLFAGAWLFVDETINLALFEVIAFAIMFAWSGVFTHCLALRTAQLAPVGTMDATEPTSASTSDERRVDGIPSSLSGGTHVVLHRRLRASSALRTAALASRGPAERSDTRGGATGRDGSDGPGSRRDGRGATSPSRGGRRSAGSRSTQRAIAPRVTASDGRARATVSTVAPDGRKRATVSACAVPADSALRRRPASERPRRRPPQEQTRPQPRSAAPRAVPVLPPRGCTASAARAASARWTTPDRR